MLNKRLLAEGRSSRPRAYIPVFGAISLLITLAGVALYFLATYVPAFVSAFDEVDLIINMGSTSLQLSGSEAMRQLGFAAVILLGSLIGLINLLKMTSRKGFYAWMHILPILSLIGFIAGVAIKFFLADSLKGDFPRIGEVVYYASIFTLAGAVAIIDIASFFDSKNNESYFAPIYIQRKRALAACEAGKAGEWKEQFAYCWRKRKYDRMMEMLFFFELDVESDEELSIEAYEYLKGKGFEAMEKQKAKEWDALYNAHQYIPLKREISLLLRSSQEGAKSLPPLSEQNEASALGKEKEATSREKSQRPLSRGEMKAIKKAEELEAKRAAKEARRQLQRQNKE